VTTSSADGTADSLGERWSFGGAAPITTSAGALMPEAVIAGAGHAVLYASLTPPEADVPSVPRPRRMPAPARPFARWARRRRASAVARTIRAVVGSVDEVSVVDSRGTAYALHHAGSSGRSLGAGKPVGTTRFRLKLEPVPARDIGWLEVSSQDGTATRLRPSPRAHVRVGQLTPITASPAERTMSDLARWLLRLALAARRDVADDMVSRQCTAALSKVAEIQRSGELDPGSQLPDQLRHLCAVLTEHRPAAGLPPGWSSILDAGGRADGPSRHCDMGAALPAIDGITVHLDSLSSAVASWRLYLRAVPGWWEYSEDGQRKRSPVSVLAEDDRGNGYLATFGGSDGAQGHEDLGLEFLPRLDPLARGLTLTFRGTREQLAVDLPVDTGTVS
jgi:hypothetical protein